ncbi:solute carrier family 23 member 1-like [Littorina saxatilis]|uniref:Solute carrier family 23 member 2 n=1 Tax=Littorina saxatilis TaxID=31220 RepID=A0AAN9BUX6_9CAEN
MGEKNGLDQDQNSKAIQVLLTETNDEVVMETTETESHALRYRLTEIPPISVSVFIALQHVLISLASALTMSSVISDALCADLGHSIRARLFGTTLFMQGLCTICQTLIGVRLPVFQGPSSSFLVPLIALSHIPGWACVESEPSHSVSDYAMGNDTLVANVTADYHPLGLSLEDKLQQLSGSLMVASLVEVAIGGIGLIRPILHRIGPLTVAPTIALIGLSLFKLPVIYAKYNPAIALGSAVLVIIFALYMTKIQIPIPGCGKGSKRTNLPIFQLLPILLAMIVMWIVCGVLTVTNALPDDKSHPFYYSRTDAKMSIIRNTPWFQITYPGQFGPPSISVAAAIGFSAAVLSSFVESVGDYYAAAKCCHVMPPPDHAMSRGIFIEGVGSFLSGAVGACHATTSYSGNIAMLSLTKTASRSVLVLAGLILVALSLVGKVAACLATLPPPILGGVLLVVLGLLATLGISTLKYADMTSNRNLLVTGVAFMSGLSVPTFLEMHGDMLATGNESADQVIRVVLGTPMFLGGVIALILDNTVPGTDIERGIIGWKMSHSAGKNPSKQDDGPIMPDTSNGKHKDGEPEQQSRKESRTKVQELTEDDVYAFQPLKGRLSSSLWRFVPFLPPNAVKQMKSNENDEEHGTPNTRV